MTFATGDRVTVARSDMTGSWSVVETFGSAVVGQWVVLLQGERVEAVKADDVACVGPWVFRGHLVLEQPYAFLDGEHLASVLRRRDLNGKRVAITVEVLGDA